jgi:PPM family protein phosphatase
MPVHNAGAVRTTAHQRAPTILRRDAGVDMATLILDVAGASRAKGSVNEDAYLVDAAHLLFGVFDGLGATSQAARAAQLAADAIGAAYRDHGAADGYGAERALLVRAVQDAGVLIAANLDDGLTTASVVKVCSREDSGATALICNIGDSRVYQLTAVGELRQRTLDDSVFGADWDMQLHLSEVVVPTGTLERRYLEQRHVLDRCLGEPGDAPRLWEADVGDGDLLLAVTDGVTDNLTFSELREVIGDGPDTPDGIAGRLVDRAYARSLQDSHARAKVDDITAVVARVRRVLASS